jgi:hypothetical protein
MNKNYIKTGVIFIIIIGATFLYLIALNGRYEVVNEYKILDKWKGEVYYKKAIDESRK